MTPLDKTLQEVTRGATNEDSANVLHVHIRNSVSDGDNPPLGTDDFTRPQKNKKRFRRRQRGKHGESAPLIIADAEKTPQRKHPRRKKNKPFFLIKNSAEAISLPPSPPEKNIVPDIHPKRRHRHGALYAALDLGTSNCRLLIATPTKPGHFHVVDAFSRIIRLGEGLGANGVLSNAAMDRAINALKICADKLRSRPLHAQRLIATEACRTAKNGAAFIARVREETGLNLEVVDRETEARLAVSGCGTLVEHNTDAIVLFDIGGGSSEIALIDVSKKRSPRLAEHIIAWTSLPVGVVSLAEHFGGEHVEIEDFERMKNYTLDLLSRFSDRYKLGELAKSPRFHLLGTSGTVTTLAGLHLDLERYDRRRVDGIWLESKDVTQMTNKLLSWNLERRVANPCIGQDRADLVLAGCAILEAIREIWPSERLRVADRGLREGILTELMARDGVWRRYPRRRAPTQQLEHKVLS